MKYFLVIGIEYKFFKKPGSITIHVGDRFIDTFLLDRDYPCATDILSHIDPKIYEKHNKTNWLTQADWVQYWNTIEKAGLYKIYEIDDIAIKGNLEISVENSNNDYTNGFMKNSSLIKFPLVALFKKDLTKNHCDKFMKEIIQLENFIQGGQPSEVRANLKKSPWTWPWARFFYVLRKKQASENIKLSNRFHWLGGDFTAQFPIIKKHDTQFIAPPEQSGGQQRDLPTIDHKAVTPHDLFLASCKQLLNIYNEDQRSHI